MVPKYELHPLISSSIHIILTEMASSRNVRICLYEFSLQVYLHSSKIFGLVKSKNKKVFILLNLT